MSTPIVLDLPTSFSRGGVVMTLQNVVGISEGPFTLEEDAYQWPGQRWVMSFQMPPITIRSIAEDWICFGLALKGRFNLVLAGDPSAKKPRGVATGTPLIKGAGQSGDTVLTDGWTPSTTGILKKGDYVQFGTGIVSRLHKVLADVNSDASGNATLQVAPSLRPGVLDNAAITTQNARGLFRLDTNDFSWSADPGPVYNLSFEMRESIR